MALSFTTLENAYLSFAAATAVAFQAGEEAITAKAKLEMARLEALASGAIDGKNAEIREAQARSILAAEFAAAEFADMAARTAKHALELARIEVERVRAVLRLSELTAAAADGS